MGDEAVTRPTLDEVAGRVSAARSETEGRGETFYPGPSRVHLAAFPPPRSGGTTCFNCESACGLLAYVDRETLQVRKFEGKPEHPGIHAL